MSSATASTTSKLILYSYWRSSCSWRVRAVLEFKRIPYEYRAISLLDGEQHRAEFRRINPAGFVPALAIINDSDRDPNRPETIITESLAIIDYLERRFPEPSIYPADPIERAAVNSIAQMIVSGIQPIQNLAVQKMVAKVVTDVNASVDAKAKSLEWSHDWISGKFEELEKILKPLSASGRFAFGDRLTLADICLVPQVYNAIRYKINMDRFPLIKRLYERLLAEEDAIERSKPENQIDFKG